MTAINNLISLNDVDVDGVREGGKEEEERKV